MPTAGIEEAVERIARELGRGASLEDLDGVLVAYSSNQHTADKVRVNFLLSKKVPADVGEWQFRHGIAHAVRPVVVPANPRLGMLGRVCVPLLVRGFRVGYLWVQQDSDADRAEDLIGQLVSMRAEIQELAELVLDDSAAGSKHRSEREEQFLAACAGAPAALDELRGWSELGQGGPWQLALMMLENTPAPRDLQAAVLFQRTAALQSTVGVELVHFSAAMPGYCVLLLAPVLVPERLTAVVRRYSEEAAKRERRPAGRAVAGLSQRFTDVRFLAAARTEALHALQAATVDPQLGDVATYRDIGVYQFLGALDWQVAAPQSVHYLQLLQQDSTRELLPLLELLYDNDASVQDVAERLHVHRSSVYNRLARIRKIIGADPMAGAVRLDLHLALKSRRWAGRPRL